MTTNRRTCALLATLLLPFAVRAQARPPRGDTTRLSPLPRELEMQLALSALPPHLRDGATVYVLNPDTGFTVARPGTNGFHAFVARTGDDTFRGAWPLTTYRDDILYPIAFDKAGVTAQMRVFFDAAAMQARGVPPQELKRVIQQRYRTKTYRPPARAGVAYMLAPVTRSYVKPDESDEVQTYSFPHVMYYAPFVANADIGGAGPGSPYPFVVVHGPHGYTIQALGEAERAAIAREYAPMLAQLCGINRLWCLPTGASR